MIQMILNLMKVYSLIVERSSYFLKYKQAFILLWVCYMDRPEAIDGIYLWSITFYYSKLLHTLWNNTLLSYNCSGKDPGIWGGGGWSNISVLCGKHCKIGVQGGASALSAPRSAPVVYIRALVSTEGVHTSDTPGEQQSRTQHHLAGTSSSCLHTWSTYHQGMHQGQVWVWDLGHL